MKTKDGQHKINRQQRKAIERRLWVNKTKQAGIGFPSAGLQRHILIVRLNIARPRGDTSSTRAVRNGLKRLCGLFERLYQGVQRINYVEENRNLLVELSTFHFSATIGFGLGFFERLKIAKKRRPLGLREMPDHIQLGDPSPYILGQTDLILQICSNSDFINHWVLDNSTHQVDTVKRGRSQPGSENNQTSDIISAIGGWATIVDISTGFQRIDNRNLLGFNDGVSNPRRLSPLFDKIVWTSKRYDNYDDGTYMVFQKIEHDLDQWKQLEKSEQEEWIGRSKGTGLLLGTLTEDEDKELSELLNDPSVTERKRKKALAKLHKYFDPLNPNLDQSNPETRFFDHKIADDPNSESKYDNIGLKCPVWSHVRKANPRQEDSLCNKGERYPSTLIFRRGYPYIENSGNKSRSGLLFISFQKDIQFFEKIKKVLNDKNFPVPSVRTYTEAEVSERRSHGRLSKKQLDHLTHEQRKALGLQNEDAFKDARNEALNNDSNNTGREGLAGPSELGVTPTGEFLAIMPLGGGYYFIPPIPHKVISDIGEQFFE